MENILTYLRNKVGSSEGLGEDSDHQFYVASAEGGKLDFPLIIIPIWRN